MKQLLLLGLMAGATLASAHIDPRQAEQTTATQAVQFRSDCDNAVAQIDLQVNNVRARLTTGGDVWWDGERGRYIVPKVAEGVPEVSSIFAAAVWMGGRDPGGNLKLAAQQHGRSQGLFDFYPGPLNTGEEEFPGEWPSPWRGTIGRDTCANWDRFFVVSGDNIALHKRNWRDAQAAGATALDPATIPLDVLGWPARGNQHFEGIHQFQLPNTEQSLAGFWDEDSDGIYEPTVGDYPIIEIRGCLQEEPNSSPDEMVFWVYNDMGNDHRQTGSVHRLMMEVQVQAFAYRTDDDLDNMTFMRYKLINRAIERIEDFHVGMWVDGDLVGCNTDDYVGADVARQLAYYYNADALDGTVGCDCGDVNTYCDEVPMLGIDILRGPLNELGQEVGMASFTYINNGGLSPVVPAATTDPQTAEEYYHYLSGRWRDSTPLTVGGSGYQSGGATTSHAFPSAPNDPAGWSMCAAGMEMGDRRTLQSSEAFTLQPGAVNEFIVGVMWVPDQPHPCPTLDRLLAADDLAEQLFDACFERVDTTTAVAEPVVPSPLMDVEVFPNPYFVAAGGTVQLRHLPENCTVSIYAMDGRLVRRMVHGGGAPLGNLVWDLRTDAGSPVGAGMYFIRVSAPGMGERTLKWVGV